MKNGKADPVDKLEQELRRGVLTLAVLSQLREAQYGYSLRQALAAKDMPIEEGTLYPLLRRMEEQGLLKSEWRIEDGPPRRYYVMSPEGRTIFERLSTNWRGLVGTVEKLVTEGGS